MININYVSSDFHLSVENNSHMFALVLHLN